MNPATAILAQQGTFGVFTGMYCCMIPLGLAVALGLVYFGVRYFAHRKSR